MSAQATGALIKAAREAAKLTKTQLAKAVPTSTMNIWRWESGKTQPSPANLHDLARVLGIAPERLLAAASAPSPTSNPAPAAEPA